MKTQRLGSGRLPPSHVLLLMLVSLRELRASRVSHHPADRLRAMREFQSGLGRALDFIETILWPAVTEGPRKMAQEQTF